MSVRTLQRFLVFALLGMGAALLGADLLLGKSKMPPIDAARSPVSYTVIRAVSAVPRGSVINPQNVVAASLSMPPRSDTLTNIADAVGRIATQSIGRDDLLSNANTARVGSSGLAEIIPLGMRAVAVRVTDELAVANLIRPGDRVD